MRTPLLPAKFDARWWPRLAVGAALVAALFLLTRPGAEPKPESTSELLSGPSPADLLSTLLIVLGLLAATFFVLPRILRKTRLAPRRERVLELVDALPLGPKRQVFVVAFRDRTLLLGAGQEDLSLLAEYANDEFDRAAPPAEPIIEPRAPANLQEDALATLLRDADQPLPAASRVRESERPPLPRVRPVVSTPVAVREATTTARKTSDSGRGRLPDAFRRMVDESMSLEDRTS